MFLLCLYPTKCCKITCQRICSARQRNAIFLFMDAFQGHYKDGTGGTYDYRSASCIGFVIRFVVCLSLIFGQSKSYSKHFVEGVLPNLIISSLFYALIQPCRKQYMNVVEALLYSTAAVVLVYTESLKLWYTNYLLAAILVPSVVFVCAIGYKLLGVLGILHQIKRIIVKIKFGWKMNHLKLSHTDSHTQHSTPHCFSEEWKIQHRICTGITDACMQDNFFCVVHYFISLKKSLQVRNVCFCSSMAYRLYKKRAYN